MDLISREAAIEALGEMPENWTDSPEEIEAVNSWRHAANAINSVPSVPAVPLDLLCVWLSKFGSPCEIDENMCDDAHGVDRCVGIFNSSAFCWRYWLTKMMEEQYEAD